MKGRFVQPLCQALLHRPRGDGYFLGQFWACETGAIRKDHVQAVREQVSRIQEFADRVGGALDCRVGSTAAQVCRPEDLDYYPDHVDLSDRSEFDMNQPQDILRRIADSLSAECHDLRKPLSEVAA